MPIELAILGCDHPNLSDVLGAILTESDLRLAAVFDEDPARIPGAIRDAAVRDPERAIGRASAVVVCAPVEERAQLLARAARAGRPALVEVPVAVNAREGALLARELARSRTPAMPALHLRALPALGRLRTALRSGHLGRPAAIQAGYRVGGRSAGPPRRGRGTGLADSAFLELAVHLVDAVAGLGDPLALSAVALNGPPGADLGGAALGRLGGTPLTLQVGRVGPERMFQLTVQGSAATASVRDGALELDDGVGVPERWIGAPPDAGEAMRRFAAGLRRQDLPREGLARAIRAQEAVERAPRV